jgi:catalase-peroxidase
VLNRTDPKANPLGDGFDYKKAVSELDVDAVKADLVQVMRTSQTGGRRTGATTAGLFIRMVVARGGHLPHRDGRGGARFR